MHLSTVDTALEYRVLQPSHCCFHLEAAHVPMQRIVGEHLQVEPPVPVHAFADALGNRFVRFDAAPGPLSVRYKADVEVHAQEVDETLAEWPVNRVPDNLLEFLLPTRYCESDLLAPFAREQFGALPPGIGRVRQVVEWVRGNIAYRAGSTTSTSTAREVVQQRAGVCRDFAHVALTLCRALNVPARLVAGYVWFDEPPQDFHAVIEAWLGGRWVLFDPTGMAPVDRLVRIGTGRDAKDVAFSTIFGAVEMLRKTISVLEHDPRGPAPMAVVSDVGLPA
jgi:transglutaminase-like putative cysteine protease